MFIFTILDVIELSIFGISLIILLIIFIETKIKKWKLNNKKAKNDN